MGLLSGSVVQTGILSILPALLTGRASMMIPLSVMVAMFGMVSCPLPPIVPPLQVMAVPVMVIGAVPFNVPPPMGRAGTLGRPQPLGVGVSLLTWRLPTDVMLPSVVVPPMLFVVPVMLYAALTLFVPAPNTTMPAPLMDDAASKLLMVV